jgi:predicted RNA-binding Zn-ribbon protein involved in translation (DUF1610 family)
VAFACDACDRAIAATLPRPVASLDCPGCGHPHALRVEAGLLAGRVDRCLRCGIERLYVQKDFNRKTGLAIFAVAALLSVPTWGLSLLAATLLDVALYYGLGDVTVCYGCGAQHRGGVRNPAHGPFDLHVQESVDRRPRTA